MPKEAGDHLVVAAFLIPQLLVMRWCGITKLLANACSASAEFAFKEYKQRGCRKDAREVRSKYWLPPRRLTHGKKIMRLFHITRFGPEIRKSGEMRRGSNGIAGGGIYFAETKAQANMKALTRGWIVTANVLVGKSKMMRTPENATFESLYASGYDSVEYFGLRTGAEYIVYNKDQVEILSILPQVE